MRYTRTNVGYGVIGEVVVQPRDYGLLLEYEFWHYVTVECGIVDHLAGSIDVEDRLKGRDVGYDVDVM